MAVDCDALIRRDVFAQHDAAVEVVDHQFTVQVKRGAVGDQKVAVGTQADQQNVAVVQRRDRGIRGKRYVLGGHLQDIRIAAGIQVDGIVQVDCGRADRRPITLDRYGSRVDGTVDRDGASALRGDAQIAEPSGTVADLVHSVGTQSHRRVAGVDGKVRICTARGHVAADRHGRSRVVVITFTVQRKRHAA